MFEPENNETSQPRVYSGLYTVGGNSRGRERVSRHSLASAYTQSGEREGY